MVGWFPLTEANQVLDAIVHHIPVFTWHPGHRQSSQFAWLHPGEVVWSKGGHNYSTEERAEVYFINIQSILTIYETVK